jgi:pyruvate ferredoxin oxidoreductase alpha subunit
MVKIMGLIGDDAVAYAVKQCDVDVVAAYPITPQTLMVETYSQFVADGDVNTEFVCVESEHSAMSACVAASLTGARVFTATASQGLALMHEILYIAASYRCPIVMGVANRTLSGPINIHCDHSDAMGSRDSGWVQIFVENPQEAYDTTIQAFKISEDLEISLPVSVNLDGFIVTHCMERVELLEDEEIREFLPQRKALFKIDPADPITVGPLVLFDKFFEIKYQQVEAMKKVAAKVRDVENEYASKFDRKYSSIQTYGLDDANVAILCMGSTAGTTRHVVKELRKDGKKVGLIKVRLFRPFPAEEIIQAVKGVKALTVMDRSLSLGTFGGPLYSDVRNILYDVEERPNVHSVIYGLGGRDVTTSDIKEVFKNTIKTAKSGEIQDTVNYLGMR